MLIPNGTTMLNSTCLGAYPQRTTVVKRSLVGCRLGNLFDSWDLRKTEVDR